MRSAVFYLIQLAAALPIPQCSSMPQVSQTTQDVEVLEFNLDTAWTKFTVSPGYKDEHTELTTSPLFFELNVNRVTDVLSTNITINEQQLDVKWDTTVADGTFFATVSSPATQVLIIPDERGISHLVDISLSGYIPVDWKQQPLREGEDTQHLSLLVLSVDAYAVKPFELDIVSRSTAPDKRLRKLYRINDMHPPGSDARKLELLSADTILDANLLADQHHGADLEGELDIEAEIESLLHLEAQAGDLSAQIAAKRHGISKCLKDHRDNVSLSHLLRQCDGVVCAAKVIAQRICDKMGVETTPNFNYVQAQESSTQQLVQIDEDEKQADVKAPRITASSRLSNNTLAGNGHFTLHTNGAAVRQSMEVIYPQSMLYRVLGVILGAFGLTALCGFIRRKCMSARSQVDELAEREERRNARAYRRAARRADMRKRWGAFLRSVSCLSMQGEPMIEDYEEKRALILQDAFLEQGLEAAEKGEVMEAEIRELRHAHEIISSLVRVDENRYDWAPPIVNDPPPPLVPLPSGRSRASTATLPSYTSELLPDYRSRVSAVSTTIASSSSSIMGYSDYPPTSSSGEISTAADTGSTPRSFSRDGSTGTRGSRFTEISSVIEISPRASEDTLRTFQRSSMAWSRRSGDTTL